jgi:VWFA-related protein
MPLKKLLFLGLSFIALFSVFPEERKKEQKPGEDRTIRVEVDMVSLPVVVTDRMGRRITDLRKEDFQIFENGVEQEIAGFVATDEPVNVALALDTSGSTEFELANIQNAAIDFVNELHPDDEVAILSFAKDVTLQQDFSIDRNKNEYGIKKTRPGGCTVEYEAVWLGLEDVLKPIKERKAFVLFTDGVDTCSRTASLDETLDLARETKATIYCVYYDTQRDLPRGRSAPTTRRGLPSIIINPPNTYPPNTYPPNTYPPNTYPPNTYPPNTYPPNTYPPNTYPPNTYPPNTYPPNTYPPNTYPPGTYPGSVGSLPSDYERGYDYLTKLAKYSGGLVFNGMTDLRYAFQQVANELASQYSIGYYSNNQKRDGKFRRIEVRIKKPGLVARTKEGYNPKKDK